MALNNAKHIVGEIDGVRCTIIEKGISLERAAFLRELLESNKLEVREMTEPGENQGEEQKYTIGVTDLVFNPVFVIYERKLRTRDNKPVTPAYWKQECVDCDPRYWLRRKSATRSTME